MNTNEGGIPSLVDLLPRIGELLTATDSSPSALERHLRDLALGRDVRLDLLSTERPAVGAPHPEVLARDSEGNSFLVAYAASDSQPWVVGNAQAWRDGDLLRVGRSCLRVTDAISIIELLWKDAGLCKDLVANVLLGEYVASNDFELAPDEISSFVETFRRTRGLCTAADFERWLRGRGFTLARFMQQMSAQAKIVIARRRHLSDRVPSFFEANRASFDAFTFARWHFPNRDAAQAGMRKIETLEFWSLARDCATAVEPTDGEDLATPPLLPSFETAFRRDLPEDVHECVDAAGGRPVLGSDGCTALRVLADRPARLDTATRRAIEKILTDRWLDELAERSPVNWNWGPSGSNDFPGRDV